MDYFRPMTFSITKETDWRIFQFYSRQVFCSQRQELQVVTTTGQSLHAQIGCADDLENYFALDDCCCFCINNMNTTSQNPATVSALPALLSPASLRPHNNIYFLSTFIIYILVDGSVPTWLPSGCFLRNTGSTCRTWLHFSRRWWSENICETYPWT